jgi:hypothetical protein
MSADGATSSHDAKVNDLPGHDHQHHRIDRPDKSLLRTGLDLVTLSKLSLEDTANPADCAPDHAEFSRLTLTDIPQCDAARPNGGRTTQHLQASCNYSSRIDAHFAKVVDALSRRRRVDAAM